MLSAGAHQAREAKTDEVEYLVSSRHSCVHLVPGSNSLLLPCQAFHHSRLGRVLLVGIVASCPALGQQPMSKCIANQLLACLHLRHPCVGPQMHVPHAGMAWQYWGVRLWAHQLSCCMASPSSAACHPSMCSSRSKLPSLAKGMTCRYEHPLY